MTTYVYSTALICPHCRVALDSNELESGYSDQLELIFCSACDFPIVSGRRDLEVCSANLEESVQLLEDVA